MDTMSPIVVILIGILVLLLGILTAISFLSKQELQLRKINPDSEAEFEGRRLYFAAIVLVGLGLIFTLSMAMYYWEDSDLNHSKGKEIFDACKTILPPIATLVLGFYFGKSASGRHSDQKPYEEKDKKSLPPGS